MLELKLKLNGSHVTNKGWRKLTVDSCIANIITNNRQSNYLK